MEVDKETLTKEQRVNAENGICPHCNGSMELLNRTPQKAEMYCGKCHYSYPLGNYR